MQEIRPSLLRRAVPWVGGMAFVIVLLVAAWRIIDWRVVAIERDRARFQSFIEDQVGSWEDALLDELDGHMQTVAVGPGQARMAQRHLRGRRWFNSLYVWELGPEAAQNQMIYPTSSSVDLRPFILSRWCIRRAMAQQLVAPPDPLRVAHAYIAGCRQDPSPAVKLYAATEAAYLYGGVGMPDQGLRALQMANLSRDASLLDLTRAGLPAHQVATYRFVEYDLLLQVGREELALDGLTRLGIEIAMLDAPDLATPLNLYLVGSTGVIAILREHGRSDDAARLEALAARAQRRLVAYREVAEQIVPREPDPGAGARFIRDQYSDEDPYVLYFGWTQGRGVALQLEQRGLLESFLRRMRAYRQHVTILGERDQWVAGARSGGDFAIVVPFSNTLGNLRVAVRESALQQNTARTNEQSVVLLVIVIGCAVLGLTALVTQVRLARQQNELISRQRAFTTRVTHELKTPLAGIRVMAENLEAGAFRTEEQRAEMARRIVDEADRLKSRVDEVLSVAQQRTIPSPAIYDPEEAVLEAIDQWGPRLEDAGVRLHADLHPTDEVLGDMAALRDAVGCLLDNALKYRHPTRDAQVWLELHQEGRQVVIEVADNGIGVPKPMRRSIFQRFVRVEGPNRGKAGGHGLGLNQVREIVEAHEGTVVCLDGMGGGARFVIRVPAQRPAHS